MLIFTPTINIRGTFFPEFDAMLLLLMQNTKQKITVKSNITNFVDHAIGPYYQQMPGRYIIGKLSKG